MVGLYSASNMTCSMLTHSYVDSTLTSGVRLSGVRHHPIVMQAGVRAGGMDGGLIQVTYLSVDVGGDATMA